MNSQIHLPDTLPDFHGNFDNWLDTFFNISCLIQNNYDENWQLPNNSEVKRIQDSQGHTGLFDLAKTWAIEFEEIHKSHNWEEMDFYKTLETFFNSKNIL